jgi:hypothetical protein
MRPEFGALQVPFGQFVAALWFATQYLPASQLLAIPFPGQYCPAIHPIQDANPVCPWVEVPAGQLEQSVDEVPPNALRNFSCPQLVGALDPDTQYLPTGQVGLVLSPGQNRPASQSSEHADVRPSVDHLPALQAVHSDSDFNVVLDVQVPSGHIQGALEPAGQKFPAPQL